MRAYFLVIGLVIGSLSDAAAAASIRTIKGNCTESGPGRTCAKCEFNAANTDVLLNTTLSFVCPRMVPGQFVKAKLIAVSTMRSANGAGTWVNWNFSFLSYSTVVTAAGGNIETRTVETFPFSAVPRDGLVSATVKPTFSQFGNAQGMGAPATLNPGSSLTICNVSQVAC